MEQSPAISWVRTGANLSYGGGSLAYFMAL
jgi:hypothetical protein